MNPLFDKGLFSGNSLSNAEAFKMRDNRWISDVSDRSKVGMGEYLAKRREISGFNFGVQDVCRPDRGNRIENGKKGICPWGGGCNS